MLVFQKYIVGCLSVIILHNGAQADKSLTVIRGCHFRRMRYRGSKIRLPQLHSVQYIDIYNNRSVHRTHSLALFVTWTNKFDHITPVL